MPHHLTSTIAALINIRWNSLLLGCFAVIAVDAHGSDSRSSAEKFLQQLNALCGERFVGEMTYPLDGNDAFAGKPLIATIAQCGDTEVRMPFTVGADRSRTWIFTLIDERIQLKHDHRHEDGTPDEITMYGGTSERDGSALRQVFPADAATQALIPAASTNVWSVTLAQDLNSLVYHLERHGKPRFTAVLKRDLKDSESTE